MKTGTCGPGYRINIDNGDGNICGAAASGPVPLTPGQSAIIYFQLNLDSNHFMKLISLNMNL